MLRTAIRYTGIHSKFPRSAASMGLRLDCVGISPATRPLNCNMCARVSAEISPSMAETANLTSPSEEKPVMKRAQVLLLAAAIVVTGGVLLLRRVAAAGGEVDVIVNKANTVDDLPIADAKKVFMGDKTTWPSGKRVSI